MARKKVSRKELISKHRSLAKDIHRASRHPIGHGVRTLQTKVVAKHLHIKDYRKVTNKQLTQLLREGKQALTLAESRAKEPIKMFLTTYSTKFSKDFNKDPFLKELALQYLLEGKERMLYTDPESGFSFNFNLKNLTAEKLSTMGCEEGAFPSDVYEASAQIGYDPECLQERIDMLAGRSNEQYQKYAKAGKFDKAKEILDKTAFRELVYTSKKEAYAILKKDTSAARAIERNYTSSIIKDIQSGGFVDLATYIKRYPKQFLTKVVPAAKQRYSPAILDLLKKSAHKRLSEITPPKPAKVQKAKLDKVYQKVKAKRKIENKLYREFHKEYEKKLAKKAKLKSKSKKKKS